MKQQVIFISGTPAQPQAQPVVVVAAVEEVSDPVVIPAPLDVVVSEPENESVVALPAEIVEETPQLLAFPITPLPAPAPRKRAAKPIVRIKEREKGTPPSSLVVYQKPTTIPQEVLDIVREEVAEKGAAKREALENLVADYIETAAETHPEKTLTHRVESQMDVHESDDENGHRIDYTSAVGIVLYENGSVTVSEPEVEVDPADIIDVVAEPVVHSSVPMLPAPRVPFMEFPTVIEEPVFEVEAEVVIPEPVVVYKETKKIEVQPEPVVEVPAIPVPAATPAPEPVIVKEVKEAKKEKPQQKKSLANVWTREEAPKVRPPVRPQAPKQPAKTKDQLYKESLRRRD